MRRAERLFEIVQILRRANAPLTAQTIAQELETSRRSVYRDIAALMNRRVPIRGEAGIGYVLEPAFDMPPLMLTQDELTAASLGAQWVALHADSALSRAAENLIAKIAAAIPEGLRGALASSVVAAQPSWNRQDSSIDLPRVRDWCREGRKMQICYRDVNAKRTERQIWPFALGFREAGPVIVAWCELRHAFRYFRVDRVESTLSEEERYPDRPDALRRRWSIEASAQHDRYVAACSVVPDTVQPTKS